MNAARGIDIQGALNRFAGNEARYRHLLTAFVEQSPASARQIRRAVGEGQFELAKWATHAFEVRVGALGLAELHIAVLALEAALLEARPAELLLEQMDQAVLNARKNIRATLGL